MDTSRPSLGFPLGTALLIIIIFSLSGIFSCCYHWDKFRSLRQPLTAPDDPPPAHRSKLHSTELKGESLPVLMPGDQVPDRFLLVQNFQFRISLLFSQNRE
ncbi:hypothetical protein RJT34_06482 [Clitoria ternatea]|uniref:Hydroxyproline-rich glycoprotein family protein n=1 Tax=Clitoria ternatea TaxID=43366 RepID=A0AAN9K2J5_CLITE